MNFYLKTFLIIFTFSQVTMAGRMFDPEMGRFISRDPLGYVDGMNLYNGYFAEKFALDPMGTTIVTDCPIDKELDKKGAFYLDFQINGKYYYYGPEQNDGSDELQIVQNMMASNYEFHIAGKKDGSEPPNLNKHIAARMAIINATKAFKMSFPDGDNPQNIPDYRKIRFSYNLWFNKHNNKSTFVGCEHGAGVCMKFGGFGLQRDADGIYIPGDTAYILNLASLGQTQKEVLKDLQAGQNIIYKGSKKWWGHVPRGIENERTLDEWIKFVNNWAEGDTARGPGDAKESDAKVLFHDKARIDGTNKIKFPGAGLE